MELAPALRQSQMMARAPMTLAQLKAKVPSVFATHASHKMSDNYTFVPSVKAVEALEKIGLVPVDASQRKAKGDPNSARHLVRFAMRDDMKRVKAKGDFHTEVVMVNSHNGRTAFKLYYGLFVVACCNGLIVSDATVGMTRRHMGDLKAIMDEADNILKQGPEVIKIVSAMKKRELTPAERLGFAQNALKLRYEQELRDGKPPKPATIIAEQLLEPRRVIDKGVDLWHTFNVVQENLVVGGLTGKSTLGRATHTRQLQDVRKLVSVNTGLWGLAQQTLAQA